MPDATSAPGRSLLLIEDAQWLAMDPPALDALVAKTMAAGKTEVLWQRLLRIETENSQPLTKAALALARSRVYLPRSQELSLIWLLEAQREAEPTPLTEVFDIAELQARIDQAPQVVDGRFTPDACTLYAFGRERWVRCPRCGGVAKIADAQARCLSCAYASEPTGWYQTKKGQLINTFTLPLLLKTTIAQGDVWAYNIRHLNQLHCYIEATMRDERLAGSVGHWCCDYGTCNSWTSILPAWMKAAKNRGKVLKALDVLKGIAADAGLA